MNEGQAQSVITLPPDLPIAGQPTGRGMSDAEWEATRAYFRALAALEALHVIVNEMAKRVATVEPVLGGPAHQVLHTSYIDAEEMAVDHLARVIAPLLPLPEE